MQIVSKKVRKPESRFTAIITPASRSRWRSGSRVAVIDHRTGAEVVFSRFALNANCQPGRPNGEWWADVIIKGKRLLIPVGFSDVTRDGGILLSDRESLPRKSGGGDVGKKARNLSVER